MSRLDQIIYAAGMIALGVWIVVCVWLAALVMVAS